MKYRIILTRTVNGTEYVIRTLKYNMLPSSNIRYGNHSFVVNFASPIYISQNIVFYAINYETGAQTSSGGESGAMTPEELDTLLGTKIVKEIVSTVSKDRMHDITNIIIGAIIGLLAGLLIGFLVMQGKIDSIPQAAQNSTQIIMNLICSGGVML